MIANIYWRMRVKQAFTTVWSAFTHSRNWTNPWYDTCQRERENGEENVEHICLDDLV
jgi:hypothetical protein